MMAQLSLIAELEDAIAHGSPQRRAEILLQVTNIFVRGSLQFSDDQISLFDDVIARLAAEIEVSVRALLAHRLAPLARAPINITQVLASDDDIRVAGPILVQSDRLNTATLLANARAKSQAHLLAISQRKSLDEEVTDVLIERGSREVVLSTAKNLGAKFSKIGFSLLVKRSYDDDLLATCVGSRPDIPHDILLALLATASEMVRAKLIAEHPQLAHEIDHAVATVTDELRNDVTARSVDYTTAQTLVQSLSDSGQLTDATIRALAEDQKFEQTVVAVAHICDVPVEIVERAFLQDQSETILILAKAVRASWPTAKALLSFRARHRGVSSAQIEQSMASFDRLNFDTARQIVEFYRVRRASVSPRDATSQSTSRRTGH
jgi:uncharacterized protein (DUF2336 family)